MTSWPVDPYTGRPRAVLDRDEVAAYLREVTGSPAVVVDEAIDRTGSAGVTVFGGRDVAGMLADLRGWTPADADLLTSAQAAGVLRISAVTFRQWVNRYPVLKSGRVFVDRRTPMYPRAVVLEAAAQRAGKVVVAADD